MTVLYNFHFLPVGSTVLQLTPVLAFSDFVDTSEVINVIQSEGYFRGSSNSLNDAVDCISHNDVALSALSGLIGHLSRMMVCLSVSLWLLDCLSISGL